MSIRRMTDNHDAGIHQDDDFLDDAEGAHNTMSINSYYRYGIAAAIHSQYHAKKTLSVVVLSNKNFGCCMSTTQIVYIHKISMHEKVNELCYYNWFLTEQMESYEHADICNCCLFLPHHFHNYGMGMEAEQGTVYAAIDSMWRDLLPTMDFFPLQVLQRSDN